MITQDMFAETTKSKVEYLNPLHSDQELIRSALIAELDATNLYISHFENLNSDHAKDIIYHILLEEKEHISELHCLLLELDNVQLNTNKSIPVDSCIKE